MATYTVPVLGPCTLPEDDTIFLDRIANQITEATAPSIGNQLAFVFSDGGSDEGLFFNFKVPGNYNGTPKLLIEGIVDAGGSPTGNVDWGFRKRAVEDNEVADGTYDAEELSGAYDISGHGDEDEITDEISLTAAHYAAGDMVYGKLFPNSNIWTYAGNILVTGVYFQYSD